MNFEEFIIASNKAETAEQVFDIFIKAMQRFGFDKSVYSFLTRHASIGYDAGHAIACAYPEDWMKHYFAKDYLSIDPVITEGLRTSRPFFWDDIPLNGQQAVLMNEAKDASLCKGIGIPLHNIDGEVAAVGLASSTQGLEVEAHHLSLLQAYAFQFHQAYTAKLEHGERERIVLSAKESEVLHWMADGRKLSDIGELMNLSEDAIRYYLKSIYGKLGVNQRTAAVIKAIRLGLLNPYRVGL
jgi:DNA-binding CsgD family transcriptional regulator